MIQKLRNIFVIPELRRKIIFTLGILVVVRVGAQVPIPGIDPEALRQPRGTEPAPTTGYGVVKTENTKNSKQYIKTLK